MKRYNHLLEKIADTDNLYLAYWKARRGKEAKCEVQRYAASLQHHIGELQQQILSGTSTLTRYHRFWIYDPKERMICAAPFRQRVLHHALINVCGELLDRKQIYDSYACRVGKGTYAALDRAHAFYRKYDWCVKMDVRKYFDNIDHLILKRQLYAVFKEIKVLQLLYGIIDDYEVSPGKGMPIGNLTSQYFANHYLSGMDHYIKEELRVLGYVRYMDDMLIFGNDREQLTEQARAIHKYLKERLNLQLKVLDLKPTTRNTQFLGYRLRKQSLLLNKRSMQRYVDKLHLYHARYDHSIYTEKDLHQHLVPLVAFVQRANYKAFSQRALQRMV